MSSASKGLDKAELRQFYRNSGVIYLYVQPKNEEFLENHEMPMELDAVALRLMSLKNQLRYHNPEYSESVQELVKITEELYQNCLKPEHKRPPRYKKQAVVISGSGMDFLSEQSYPPGMELLCHISFPEYPYTMIDVEAKVVKCEELHGSHRYKTAISFHKISERIRDHIIQFVNSLTRQQRTKDLK
ncbi:MAG: PilZ domain-containing protein [Deltaproteobacteria bacterium]|nr:MAG: PilZ domain-containing protein [Deltaproteobacteria bacterium]